MQPNTMNCDTPEALRFLASACERPIEDEWMRKAADEIERLRTGRRWIPVSERLPTEGVDVLVSSPCPNSDKPNIDIASWGSEGKHGTVWREADCGRIEPTHWMPLPQPPEETK